MTTSIAQASDANVGCVLDIAIQSDHDLTLQGDDTLLPTQADTYTSFMRTHAGAEVQGTVGPGIQRAKGAQARRSKGPKICFRSDCQPK